MAGMNDIIMANPMGAIGQAVQTAGAMDQLSRMRTQDQTMQQDRGMELQDRQSKLAQAGVEFAAKAGTALDQVQDPAQKAAMYKQLRSMAGIQGFNVDAFPSEYTPAAQQRLDLAKAQVLSGQTAKYGTSATYFRDPTTGKVVAAQGNQAGGFHVGGRAIPGNWEPVAAPNTQYSQEMQNQRFYDKPQIAGQSRQAEANVDIVTKPIIAGGEAEARLTAEQKIKPETAARIAEAKANVAAAVEKRIKQEGQLGKLEDADRIYQALSAADLGAIYGRGESLYPTLMRNQAGIDLMAQRDQMVGMLELAAAGEMKGQGQITEPERKILKDSATTLAKPDISPELARASIDRAMAIIYRNAGQKFVKPDTGPAAPQQGGNAHVIFSHPTLGDVTEDDVAETMRKHGVSREQVLQQIGAQDQNDEYEYDPQSGQLKRVRQ